MIINILIHKQEITLINSNIINDIVNIIITKNHQYTNCLTLLKSTCECKLTRFCCSMVNWVPIILCKQTSYLVSITLIPNLDRIKRKFVTNNCIRVIYTNSKTFLNNANYGNLIIYK